MDTLVQDVQYALRTLRRSPGFALVAALTLALGIGANTAIFSVVDAVLLRPLPYRAPERLVGFAGIGGFKGEFLELRRDARTLEVAAFADGEFNLTGEGEPIRLEGAAVSAELFPLLGVEPAIGRAFRPEEMRPGAEAVVVLSYGLWQERFGGDGAVLGRAVRVDGVARTVVGVMPAGVRFPGPETRVWVPLTVDPADRIGLWSTPSGLIGRLRPRASLEQAREEVRTLLAAMRELFPWDMPPDYAREATLVPLHEQVVGHARPLLLVLLASVGFVLLIACANVVNLLLVRVTARRQELAVRAALGAGRSRLVRQLVTESLVLALAGGAAGLVLAAWAVELLTAWLPADTPRLAEIGIDGRVLGYAAGVALLTGLVFGALPALRASTAAPRPGLDSSGRVAGGGRRGVAGALVAAEVALAVVLVTGAGLLVRSFRAMLREDPGFVAERVVSAEVAPPELRYRDDDARRRFHHELLARMEALPGVSAVAATDRLPFAGRAYGSVFIVEGRPDPATTGGEWPWSDVRAAVSEDYFRALGIRLLRGRGFTAADREDAPRVAVIGRNLAREYWPDEDPIGKRIRFPGDRSWTTIVGIVADVRYEELTDGDRAALYLPLRQAGIGGPLSVVVRTASDPAGVAASLRGIVASLDPDTPVHDVATMDRLVSRSLARPRFATALLGGFALLALALGAVGLYGVLAYAVGQRTREIGVRMALGARAGDVTTMVIRRGLTLTAIGLAAGLLAALPLTRLLAGLLYGVRPHDPATYLAVPPVLLGAALLASWIPARRAARVDPAVALRGE